MSIYEDGSYLTNNPTWHEEHSAWKAGHIRRLLKANNLQPTSLAEVGCGAGQILVELSNTMPDVKQFTGYEISPQAFALCAEKRQKRVQFINSDILSTPPAEQFDVVTAIDVFEHVEDYIGFIRKMKKVGCYQVFHIPLELSVSSILRPSTLAAARREVGHIQFFTRDTALASLEHAGLRIVDVRHTSIAVDLAEGMSARLLRLPRKVLGSFSEDLSARVLGGYHALVLTQ